MSSTDFSSKRHFHWTKKVATEDHHHHEPEKPNNINNNNNNNNNNQDDDQKKFTKKKLQPITVTKLKLFLTTLNKKNMSCSSTLQLGSKVIGTLFGNKRGHVQLSFQKNPNSPPSFLIELATPINGLVKEMASGLVRIALECDKVNNHFNKKTTTVTKKLLDEPAWRTYCNGKKCGFATRKECGDKEWKVLKAVEPISMGAGVLPASVEDDGGEVMYMRAKFERIVGSRDSEAFYMMNPDSNGTPELSVYLLRI
ncbi:hypothetical protein ACFE04_006274 [Oxalis oulophora]